jgi:hypothetical protein
VSKCIRWKRRRRRSAKATQGRGKPCREQVHPTVGLKMHCYKWCIFFTKALKRTFENVPP